MIEVPKNPQKIPENTQNTEIEQKRIKLREEVEKTKQFTVDTIIKSANEFVNSGKALNNDFDKIKQDYQDFFNTLRSELEKNPQLKKYFEGVSNSDFSSHLKEIMFSFGYYFDVNLGVLNDKKNERYFFFDTCCSKIIATKEQAINNYFPDNPVFANYPAANVLFVGENLAADIYQQIRTMSDTYIRIYGLSDTPNNRIVVFSGSIYKEQKQKKASEKAIQDLHDQVIANEAGHMIFHNFFKEEERQIPNFGDFKLSYLGVKYNISQIDDAFSVLTELSALNNNDFIEAYDLHTKKFSMEIESYAFNKVYFSYVFDKLAEKYGFKKGKDGQVDFKKADLLTQAYFREEFVKMAHDGLFSLMTYMKQQFDALINRSKLNIKPSQ